jgi:outer membrane receptor protein involved in Fe transport
MYAVRGSLRFEPTETTRIDLMGYYFREKDNRARIQKQLCQRDATGVLGCLPNRLDFGATNANSTFVGVLSSRELLAINTASGGPAFQGLFTALGLGSLYGPDAYSNFVNPANVRQVRTDFTPEYFASEQQYQARLEQELGAMKLQVTGMYLKSKVDSRQDYNLSVQNGALYAPAIAALTSFAGGGAGPLSPYFAPLLAAATAPGGQFCTSETEGTGTGSFGGHRFCSATPQDFDRSNTSGTNWSTEAILSSDFDGKFNFLLGAIYLDGKVKNTDYYVNSFGIDWVTGVLGAATAIGGGLAPGYLGTPFFRNQTPSFSLKSYGLFGEAYIDLSDKLKVTLGIRYNSDKKSLSARSTLASFYVPATATDAYASLFAAGFDADPKTVCAAPGTTRPGAIGSVAGCEAFQNRKVSFSEWTGRAVMDYKLSEDSLVYASFSRGYKSGGINPPLQPIFAVSDSFEPEFINAFEIGSKNSFANGKLTLNATAFYYQYKALQLSRIVARTSVNDNVDANIYGLELESIIRPDRNWAINMGGSYLKTKVSQDKFLGNPRDPSGGRADAVIIKDISNGANCAVVPTTAGNAAGTNTLVGAINGGLGLRAPAPFAADGGVAATGAFGLCSVIAGTIANPPAALRGLFATPTGALPFTVENAGVPVNIKGNRLPQAPNFKWNVGVQYTAEFDNGMTLVPRADLIYVGDSYGNIFNGRVNKISGYSQVNAQVQLNGNDDKWFVRGFIQNLTNNNATTGLYVTDQSSGLFTNIFTLEPRRYGISAGFKF